jgi:DNA-directed RNA polymerase specialized sigma24 family protein
MKVKRNRKLNGYLLKMSMEQPDHTLPYNISYKKLYYCLGKLPEKTQFILVLHFWRKMTFQAVAVEIGDSLTSVTSAADRGYQNMYDLLTRKSQGKRIKFSINFQDNQIDSLPFSFCA